MLCYCVCVSQCVLLLLTFFFFFKQKTAYEMRISDWSSDVCSSDLLLERARQPLQRRHPRPPHIGSVLVLVITVGRRLGRLGLGAQHRLDALALALAAGSAGDGRSEEHTSELQSLMRISYAGFCLKKKKTIQINRAKDVTVYERN